MSTYYLSTYGGTVEKLSREAFEAEQRRIWPLGYEKAEAAKAQCVLAEAARIERDTAEAGRLRAAREAFVEINAQKAAEIESDGQPDGGLPKLSGTSKQIAYAISIRSAYAVKNPNDGALMRGTTAKYWIENHRKALFS